MSVSVEWRLEGVHFGYGERAVIEGISFSARGGELLAIVGPNGCGKSTLLKLMLGALSLGQAGAARGEIVLDGKAVRAWGRIGMARRAAFVPQMAGAGEDAETGFAGMGFTVLQTVLMARYALHVEERGGILRVAGGLGIFGFETAGDHQAATQAMWDADVHHLAGREIETLSGGERQRVALARAFAQETPAVLLDEPTSALDLYHQLELMAQLQKAAGEGRLVVLVTHDLNLARQFATRVLVMDRGKLAAEGAPEKVLVPEVLAGVYQVNVRVGAEGMLHFSRGPGQQESRGGGPARF